MSADTIVARLLDQSRKRPHHPAYFEKSSGTWAPTDWAGYAARVRDAARGLIALGFAPGDTLCILGFNRPEWAIADMAAMAAGGAAAGIYTTSSAPEVSYIIGHAGARIAVLEDQTQWQKVLACLEQLPDLQHVILMRDAEHIAHPMVLSWAGLLALAEQVPEQDLEDRIEALDPAALATLIYTSGTTGPPKGVMLSHDNLAWTASLAGELIDIGPSDSTLSYLPLSHIAEQLFTLHGAVTYGYTVYYAESLETVRDNLVEVEPTLLFAVPRIWEKIHAGIEAKLVGANPAKLALFRWASGVGRRHIELLNAGEPAPGLLQLQHRLADKLVFRKVKAALGLGRLRFPISGAAPIAREVLEFFAGLDVRILEVYGQSEDTGPTSFNRPGATAFGTVGPPVPGVDVRIADDGEILVKGRNVFMGYYKDERATAATLVDGWLHSGDLGHIDASGYLHITGRKKEIIITAGGKNIAPKNIEAALKNDARISEAVVIGDRRHYLSALIWLDPQALQRLAATHGVPAEQVPTHPDVIGELQQAVDAVNTQFAQVEHIRRFTLLAVPLSIEEGELTPTLKVKRNVVADRFKAPIDAMYA